MVTLKNLPNELFIATAQLLYHVIIKTQVIAPTCYERCYGKPIRIVRTRTCHEHVTNLVRDLPLKNLPLMSLIPY